MEEREENIFSQEREDQETYGDNDESLIFFVLVMNYII